MVHRRHSLYSKRSCLARQLETTKSLYRNSCNEQVSAAAVCDTGLRFCPLVDADLLQTYQSLCPKCLFQDHTQAKPMLPRATSFSSLPQDVLERRRRSVRKVLEYKLK